MIIVRPLEYINLPSGMAVAIYADEGCNYRQKLDDAYTTSCSDGSGNNTVCASSTSSSSATFTTGASMDGSSSVSSSSSSNNSKRGFWRQHQLQSNSSIQILSQETTTPYDLSTFLRFAIQCTDCLEFIHRHNTLHGEVRLSAFQYQNDRVKLWNFGSNARTCEKYLTSEGWRKTASHREAIEQLLVYMSPEQTGRTTYTADHRSDIYSLGIVFFILLTGQTPFDGGPLEILNGILSRKVPLVHEIQLDVPEIVSSIVEKMTNKVRLCRRGKRGDENTLSFSRDPFFICMLQPY